MKTNHNNFDFGLSWRQTKPNPFDSHHTQTKNKNKNQPNPFHFELV